MYASKKITELKPGDVICSKHFAHARYDPKAEEPFMPIISFEGKPYHGFMGQWPPGHPANDPERANNWYMVEITERTPYKNVGGNYAPELVSVTAVGLHGMLRPDPERCGRIRISIRPDKTDPSVDYWGTMDQERTKIVYILPK